MLSVWLFSRDTIMNVFSDSCDTPRSSLVSPRFKDSELQYKFANTFARATLAPRIRTVPSRRTQITLTPVVGIQYPCFCSWSHALFFSSEDCALRRVWRHARRLSVSPPPQPLPLALLAILPLRALTPRTNSPPRLLQRLHQRPRPPTFLRSWMLSISSRWGGYGPPGVILPSKT